jgi:hypothetical protein
MRRTPAIALLSAALLAAACGERSGDTALAPAPEAAPAPAPRSAGPLDLAGLETWSPRGVMPVEDLTLSNTAVAGVVAPTIIDTRTFPQQVQVDVLEIDGEPLRSSLLVPPHKAPPIELVRDAEDRSGVALGSTADGVNVVPRRSFTTITNTGWNPPDPTLAVGPDHVVVTVNSSIAFYTKDGTVQFQARLGSQGSPGFFEDVGARSFVFDPKCMFDHTSGRFIIVAPEVYGTGTSTPADDEATIAIAVSDDDDPNGVWFKYRTNAVTTIGPDTFWWDYPGFGFDEDAIYVTSNLFPLDPNVNAFGGAGFRIFDKAPILAGAPTTFSTLRDGSLSSVQIAQHFGPTPTPYFASIQFSSALTVTSITDPLTAPSIVTEFVPVTPFSFAGNAQTPGGSVSTVGSRIMNVHWRSGRLLAGHTVFEPGNGENQARWYEVDTNGWPASGSPPFVVQSGQIDDGPDDDTYFPALYSDDAGNIGLVAAVSSPSRNVAMTLTGRRLADPPGQMGRPLEVFAGDFGSAGRWGDYYDMALDPIDGTALWAIGMTQRSGGWHTHVAEFSIADAIDVVSPDGGESLVQGQPTSVEWTGNPAGVFQVQQSSNFGEIAVVAESFEGGSLPPGFSTSGDASWSIDASTAFDGVLSARSGAIGNLQSTTLETTVEGPTTASFAYRTSSESGDALRFLVNGEVQLVLSGDNDWAEFSIEIPEGFAVLAWEYEKSFTGSAGEDAAWIDLFGLETDVTRWADVVAETAAGASAASWTPADDTASAKVRVRELLSPTVATTWTESDAPFVVVPTPGGCPGDVTGDDVVDVFDFSELAAAFGSGPGDANWNPAADFDGNGEIDVFDFSTLAAAFGLPCP